jgi:hypothetical protein
VTLRRLPLLLLPLAAVSLLFGLLAGLIRLGWALPTPATNLILLRGPLMVAGFFGTGARARRRLTKNRSGAI